MKSIPDYMDLSKPAKPVCGDPCPSHLHNYMQSAFTANSRPLCQGSCVCRSNAERLNRKFSVKYEKLRKRWRLGQRGRARKVKAEADKIERQNEIEAEKYISLEELKPYVQERTSIANRIISGFKGRVLEIAPMMPKRAVKQLDAEIQKMHRAMNELNDNTQNRRIEGYPVTK